MHESNMPLKMKFQRSYLKQDPAKSRFIASNS